LGFKRILFGEKDVFGLDVGSSSVKAVQLDRFDNGYKVLAAEQAKIIQTSSGSQALNDSVILAIRRCFKSLQTKTRFAVCGVCGPDVAVRPFKLHDLPEEELGESILFEAEQVCPFDRGQYLVDYEIIDDDKTPETSENKKQDKKTRGILVAATSDVISKKGQLVRGAALSCVLMDIDGLALLNCFSECEKLQDSETVAIIDIGSQFTNLVILSEKRLPFIRDIPSGGADIINQLAENYRLPSQVIEDILQGQGDENIGNREIIENLGQGCAKLITSISDTLRYYAAQEGGMVNRILLCGGFSQIEGFVNLLDQRLPSNVELWNPLAKMNNNNNEKLTKKIESLGPSLTLAAGLAMRSI